MEREVSLAVCSQGYLGATAYEARRSGAWLCHCVGRLGAKACKPRMGAHLKFVLTSHGYLFSTYWNAQRTLVMNHLDHPIYNFTQNASPEGAAIPGFRAKCQPRTQIHAFTCASVTQANLGQQNNYCLIHKNACKDGRHDLLVVDIDRCYPPMCFHEKIKHHVAHFINYSFLCLSRIR